MHKNRRMLEHVLTAYGDGDLDDCIRRVRTLVEAAPLAPAPRQLLASLYAETGKARQALVHYRKLLPQAIERGHLFRSIAIQKQIDSLRSSGTPDPQRWASLLTQIRSHGVPHLAASAGTGRPWVEAQMLSLPRVWFDRVIEETRVQVLGLGSEPEEVEADTVWEVLTGRMRWSFQLPNGRVSSESPAADGDAIHVDPEIAPRARVTFLVELPVECLRFEASLTRELRRELAASQPLTGVSTGGFTPDARALLPTSLRRREDLDVAPSVPPPGQGEGPPRLAPPLEGAAPTDASRDTGEWVEHGVLSLSASPADSGGDESEVVPGTTIDLTPDAAGSAGPSDDPPRERTIELPPPGETPARRRGRPVVERPGPQEMGDGLIVPPTPDPFAAPIPDLGKPIERRRHPRVAASFQTRVAMLRLPGTRVAPVHGELFDLTTRGLGLRFSKDLAVSGGALADAVVAVELDVPGSEGPLRMAAQVRWLEVDEDGTEARIGIEFVLMTEPDRRRIEAALASVPQPAGDAAAEAP